MSEEMELVMGEDGVLHMKAPKPTICLSFESDDALIAWISNINHKSLLPDNTEFEFINIENEDEFLEKLNSKIECDTLEE